MAHCVNRMLCLTVCIACVSHVMAHCVYRILCLTVRIVCYRQVLAGQLRFHRKAPRPRGRDNLARIASGLQEDRFSPDDRKVTILHFNDVYHVAAREDSPCGGAARVAGLILDVRKEPGEPFPAVAASLCLCLSVSLPHNLSLITCLCLSVASNQSHTLANTQSSHSLTRLLSSSTGLPPLVLSLYRSAHSLILSTSQSPLPLCLSVPSTSVLSVLATTLPISPLYLSPLSPLLLCLSVPSTHSQCAQVWSHW